MGIILLCTVSFDSFFPSLCQPITHDLADDETTRRQWAHIRIHWAKDEMNMKKPRDEENQKRIERINLFSCKLSNVSVVNRLASRTLKSYSEDFVCCRNSISDDFIVCKVQTKEASKKMHIYSRIFHGSNNRRADLNEFTNSLFEKVKQKYLSFDLLICVFFH